ncbi:MAG: transketolase C-terminal domain-containing protein [Nibricoccus sp.]
MKNALVDEASRLAATEARLVVLNALDEPTLFQKFGSAQPKQLFDTSGERGATIGLAAGLASSGLRPLCVLNASSASSEYLHQIKFDVCYHGLPVVIVGTDTGLSAIAKGESHLALQDIAAMRTLPGMRVLAPADPMELRSCLRAALSENGPTYIRIGAKGESAFFPERPAFSFGVWKQVRQGSRVTLLVTGSLMSAAIRAADILEQTSLCPRVCSCASIKPLDTSALLRYFTKDELVVTIEEHSRIGGFGSAVSEWLTDNSGRQHARLLRLGTEDEFLGPTAIRPMLAKPATSAPPPSLRPFAPIWKLIAEQFFVARSRRGFPPGHLGFL